MSLLVTGAEFILATFPLEYQGRPLVLATGDTLAEVLKEVDELLEPTVVVCSIDHWTTPGTYGGMDCTPHGVRELYRITRLED